VIVELSEGLGLVVTGIKVFENIDRSERRAAANIQGVLRVLAWYEEILKEKPFFLARL
jgi:hypothetical protein